MTVNEASSTARPGFFERTVTRLLMRPARVTAVADLTPAFRVISFQGNALKDCNWKPGDKLQIKLDGSLSSRTYTPIEWSKDAGSTQIVAYCHGIGPGSDWARNVGLGDERQLFGPRTSIKLDGLSSSPILFGDETSAGIAVALRRLLPDASGFRFLAEVSDVAETAQLLRNFDVDDDNLVQRHADDGHLSAMTERLVGMIGADNEFILTGKSTSIQKMSRALKAAGLTSRRIRAKAYWAPGKTGLD